MARAAPAAIRWVERPGIIATPSTSSATWLSRSGSFFGLQNVGAEVAGAAPFGAELLRGGPSGYPAGQGGGAQVVDHVDDAGAHQRVVGGQVGERGAGFALCGDVARQLQPLAV